MATYTENYNLKKPDPEDFVDVVDLNRNADAIDLAVKTAHDRADDAYALAEKAKTESDVFIATYGKTTSAEIEAAYQAGKVVLCKISNYHMLAPLTYRNSADYVIFITVDTTGVMYNFLCDRDNWYEIMSGLFPTEHASTHARGGSDQITPESIGAANKPTISTSTMLASRWSNGTYSFENSYPVANYDIEIALDSTATINQAEAFNGAQIVGSATNNIAKAYGIVPTIDIPIIVKVVVK